MTLVEVQREGSIATVELHRKQKRNALDVALRDALETTLVGLEADDAVKVVILTGGEEMFSAGYDLAEMVGTDLGSLFHRGHEYTRVTSFFKKPLITAVAGFALAGGFDLALSGDIIIATEGTRLGRPEIRWGVNPLMSKLHLRMGFAPALRFTLKGEVVDAEDALALGIVDAVVRRHELIATARHEAEQIAAQPLPVLLAVKRAAYQVPTMTPLQAIEYEFGVTAELVQEGTPRRSLASYAKEVGVLK